MKSPLQQELDNDIPRTAVKSRSQAGMSLSYLETWYVIDRLNQVFGQGKWAYKIDTLTKVFEGTIQQSSGETYATSYISTVTVTANVDGQVISFSDVGYGDGTDKRSPGKAHELATKEAVSDALKRAAKNLGRSMGLALYDKTQEFVGEDVPRNSKELNSPTPVSQPVAQAAANPGPVVPSNTPPKIDPKVQVTSAFAKLKAAGQITADEFKAKYQGGIAISKLSNTKLTEIYQSVCKDFGL
jgi:DNA recombination protein Rad52